MWGSKHFGLKISTHRDSVVKKKEAWKKKNEVTDKVIDPAWPKTHVIVYHSITSPLQSFYVIAYEPIVQVEAAS